MRPKEHVQHRNPRCDQNHKNEDKKKQNIQPQNIFHQKQESSLNSQKNENTSHDLREQKNSMYQNFPESPNNKHPNVTLFFIFHFVFVVSITLKIAFSKRTQIRLPLFQKKNKTAIFFL